MPPQPDRKLVAVSVADLMLPAFEDDLLVSPAFMEERDTFRAILGAAENRGDATFAGAPTFILY